MIVPSNSFVTELLAYNASFAALNPVRPFTQSSAFVILELTSDEVKAFKEAKFDAETNRLARLRCSTCSVGRIYVHKHSGRLRYNCVCDGSDPINQTYWNVIE